MVRSRSIDLFCFIQKYEHEINRSRRVLKLVLFIVYIYIALFEEPVTQGFHYTRLKVKDSKV